VYLKPITSITEADSSDNNYKKGFAYMSSEVIQENNEMVWN
jgi:hypothetical protein